jgi:hypothetical protein
LTGNVDGKKPAMSFVFSVVGETAALCGQGANEIGVGDTCGLEFPPEKSPPAPLEQELIFSALCPGKSSGTLGILTGLPVMESPNGIILTLAWHCTPDTKAPTTARDWKIAADRILK